MALLVVVAGMGYRSHDLHQLPGPAGAGDLYHDQRTKEIGIRKIIGATVSQIVMLLSVDFLKLVGWAFLIAAPLAWWGAHSWLDNFAYRTGISWWIFLAGGAGMGGMSFVMLFLRTFRAANANPAESLRTE